MSSTRQNGQKFAMITNEFIYSFIYLFIYLFIYSFLRGVSYSNTALFISMKSTAWVQAPSRQ